MKKYWIDSHCHLFDLDQKKVLSEEIEQAKDRNIELFLCSALSLEEYIWYDKKEVSNILWYAGIHPFYEKSDEKDIEKLIELCEAEKIIGIGETGLDKRNSDDDKQKKILLKQLDIAKQFQLAVVFHIVGKYYEVYKLLKNNFPETRGLLHGFNASVDIARLFNKFDISYSLGCHLPHKEALNYIIEKGNFCFETDAPYQKPTNSKSSLNHLKNLLIPIEYIEKAFSLSSEYLMQKQMKTLIDLFPQIIDKK